MNPIGEKVVVIKQIKFNNKVYNTGHIFTVTGEDDIRGLDLEDDEGNRIGETRFIRDHYEFLYRLRDNKLSKIL